MARQPPSIPETNLSEGDIAHAQETAWIEVIRKMEEVYSDLIQYEIELEEKNTALEEAQRFITSVLSSVSDILVVCDSKGRIQQVNLAFLHLTDMAETDLIGMPLDHMLADDVQQLSHWLEAGHGGDREVRFVHGGQGATDPVALTCATLLDHRGLPAGTVLTGRPVGELRRAYEALKQAQAQLVQQEKMASLGRLIAGVAHELNNPISFIVGNIHVLTKYRERLEAYLGAIHQGVSETERDVLRRSLRIDALMGDLPALIAGTQEGAQRVADIVKSLKRLSFSQGAAAEAVNLADIAENAVHWVIKGRNLPGLPHMDLPATLLAAGQTGQLHQVVVNLVENALDAVDGDARAVSLRGRVEGNRVTLDVCDQGPGIAPENLGKVFEPFFTTKPVGQGTGLGLWISYGIVRDHGGELIALNRPEGGACLRLTLPAA
ncbi:ATP-binding protein [Magnetospirillum sp. 64-120]|uniref:PAS domain-containing sensor histidine kinase n=1 Tax=Magnetospirillum sp. 64-120 TaxID=1895778 RepID=UPI00092C2FFF|nr:ATP-binding protein [Magnetospirillum sp. 64-120]OJX70521.1 MAG: PAS domain-containing sensor histidine kinase [Magnetospirillum sp. 64-120]